MEEINMRNFLLKQTKDKDYYKYLEKIINIEQEKEILENEFNNIDGSDPNNEILLNSKIFLMDSVDNQLKHNYQYLKMLNQLENL